MTTTTYPKGLYQAEVLEQGYEESSAKGTPAFFLQLRIVGRYDDTGKLVECPQYERTYRQYLNTETGVRILIGDLKTLGVQVTEFTQLVNPAASGYVSLGGRKIDATCDIESYQGKPQERWGIPRSRKKLDLSAVRTLNDQFGHLLRDGKGPSKATPGVTAPNNSDQPF